MAALALWQLAACGKKSTEQPVPPPPHPTPTPHPPAAPAECSASWRCSTAYRWSCPCPPTASTSSPEYLWPAPPTASPCSRYGSTLGTSKTCRGSARWGRQGAVRCCAAASAWLASASPSWRQRFLLPVAPLPPAFFPTRRLPACLAERRRPAAVHAAQPDSGGGDGDCGGGAHAATCSAGSGGCLLAPALRSVLSGCREVAGRQAGRE